MCGALARSVDWSRTPLGEPESWPAALKTTLGTLFNSRFPMFLWWGPELIQFYNDAYLPSFGVGKHPAAMGQRGVECWPEIWPIIGPQIHDVMERGIPSWNEDQLVPIERNGRLEDVYWTYGYSPVFDENHEVVATLVVCQETTAQVMSLQRAHRERDEAEDVRTRLLALFSSAPAFVCMLNGPEHVFEMVNPLYEQLVGTGRHLVGKSVAEALPEVVGQGFFDLLDHVYRSGEVYIGSETWVRLERRPGKLEGAYVTFVYQPHRDVQGKTSGIDVFGFDVTEHVNARRQAEQAAETRRVLAEAIPQQVWTAAPTGEIDFINQRVLDFFAAPPEEILGTGWTRFVHPEDLNEASARWTESLASGREYEVEFRLQRHDGEYRWYLARAVPLRAADGSISQWFGTNTDIDDRRRLTEALQMRADFERHLIGIVSHDLRNPLNVISLGTAVLASSDDIQGSSAKSVLRIQSAARRSERLIRDLLDFTEARVGGGISVVPTSGNVFDVVREVVDHARTVHFDSNMNLTCQGSGEATFDADRLAQALTNLIANAAQYGAPGEPIDVRVDATGPRLVFSVHNRGTPIAPALLPSLFEPLQRGTVDASHARRSVGLGLYIVSAIVRAHGGKVDVRSNEEEGTTFAFCLPREI